MGGGNRGRKKRGVWKIICNFAIGYFAQRHKSSNNQNSIMLNNNFTGNPIGGVILKVQNLIPKTTTK